VYVDPVFLGYSFFSAPVDYLDLHSFPTRRSSDLALEAHDERQRRWVEAGSEVDVDEVDAGGMHPDANRARRRCPGVMLLEREDRSEEHTSELQSRGHLVCRLLLEKKKIASVIAFY